MAIMLPIMVLIGAVLAVFGAKAVDLLVGPHKTYTTTPSPAASMEPTLTPGESVDVNLNAYSFGDDPQVGDIVLFNPPPQAKGQCSDPNAPCVFIERIVAGPNDTLRIRNGHPVVNGAVAQEDYIRPCPRGSGLCNDRWAKPFTIPPGQYYMMGDNRAKGNDSRSWGPVPRGLIHGRVEQLRPTRYRPSGNAVGRAAR